MPLDHILVTRAEKDLVQAFRWYAVRSPQAARRFIDAVNSLIVRISSNPDGFPVFDSRHRFANVRRFPYLVLFRYTPQLVWIVGIGHNRRSGHFWKMRTG